MTLLTLLCLAVSPALLPTGVPSPQGTALGLDEVLGSAEKLSPSLLSARADSLGADAERLVAAGGFDPALRARASSTPIGPYRQVRLDSIIEVPTSLWGTTFFGGYRLGAGEIPDYYAERRTWSGGELRAGFTVPLLRNGPIDRRRAAIERARLGSDSASASLEAQQLEVRRLATNRYWEWVAAGRRRDVAKGLLTLALERGAQLAARQLRGDVAVFERQDNERAIVQRESFTVQMSRGLEQAALELSFYLRDREGQPVVVDQQRLPLDFEPPENRLPAAVDGEVERALARRPEMARFGAQLEQLQLELRLQQNQLLPGLEVGAAISRDVGRPGAAADVKLGQPELEVSAVLDVPLLYRAPLGRIKVAQAAVTRLQAQLQMQRDKVVQEVRDARSALSAADQRVGFTRAEIALAESLEGGERTRFDLGESTLLFVNLREQQTAEARLREIDALLEAHRAEASYRAATADGLRAWASSP